MPSTTLITQSIVSKSAAYTATNYDETVLGDATSAGFTITLPAAASVAGKRLRFKKIDSTTNIVLIDGNASETIDGALTFSLSYQNQELDIQSDGTNWQIISFMAANEIKTVNSGQKTPTASGNWANMTTNSVVLTPGTWRLHGRSVQSQSGTAGFTSHGVAWMGANGADSASTPVTIDTVTGITVLTVNPGGFTALNFLKGFNASSDEYQNSPTILVKVTQNATVFLVAFAEMTTAANARLQTQGAAERVS